MGIGLGILGVPVFSKVIRVAISTPVVNGVTTTITLNLPNTGSTFKIALINASASPANKTQIAPQGAQFPEDGFSDTQTVASGFSGTISVTAYLGSGNFKVVAADDTAAYFSVVFSV